MFMEYNMCLSFYYCIVINDDVDDDDDDGKYKLLSSYFIWIMNIKYCMFWNDLLIANRGEIALRISHTHTHTLKESEYKVPCSIFWHW